MSNRAKVTVIYKSGAKVTFTCDSFDVKWNQTDGRITSYKAEGMEPRAVMLGMREVAAIWKGKV